MIVGKEMSKPRGEVGSSLKDTRTNPSEKHFLNLKEV